MMLASFAPWFAPVLLGWLATYLVHSTVWLGGAWLVARLVRSAPWRARLWKGAVFGGIASATLVGWIETSPVAWRVQAAPEVAFPASARATGEPIALDVSFEGAASVASGSTSEPVASSEAPAMAIEPIAATWRASIWIVLAWLVVAATALVHLGVQHLRLRRALAHRRRPAESSLCAELERLRHVAGSRRRATLSVSPLLSSPIVLARGEIVVPERVTERLSPKERETLLAHELAHLERRDAWWLIALSIVERALFLQPLNRLATRRTIDATEHACDELAARWTDGGLALARCLAEVATWTDRPSAPGLTVGLAERPSGLLTRVERLLSPRPVPRFQGIVVALWFAISFAALACSGPHVTAGEDEEAELAEMVDADSDAPAVLGGVTFTPIREVLENKIAALSLQQQGYKPENSKFRRIEQEIAELERQLDALGKPDKHPRISEALARLRARTDHGSADHLGVSESSVGFATDTVTAHHLELRGDGSIRCGAMLLVFPESRDDRLLRHHLADIAAAMPQAPFASDGSDVPALPDGTMELLIDEDAPHHLLQRTLQICGTKEVRIWRFQLVYVRGGEPGESIPFALPRDVGVSEDLQPTPQPLEIGIRIPDPARSVMSKDFSIRRILEYHLGAWAAELESAEGLDFARGHLFTTDLSHLRSILNEVAEERPQRLVLLDPDPTVQFSELNVVIDAAIVAGFTDITFVGASDR